MQQQQQQQPLDPRDHAQLMEQQERAEKVRQAYWALAYTIGVMPLDAFMIWLLWGFFVVPFGVVAINYWWALGIDIFVSYMFSTSGVAMGMLLLNAHFNVPLDARQVVKNHLGVVGMTLVLAIAARLLMQWM